METPRIDGPSAMGNDSQIEGYHISIGRIILLSVVSGGFFWIFWMYRTWKQYRDYTGATAYPVWHALTQFVPIYGWFRFYAHCEVYKTLMEEHGIGNSLKLVPIIVVTVVAATGISQQVGFIGLNEDKAQEYWLMLDIIKWVAFVVLTTVLCWIQTNINRYWASVDGALAARARIGKGEILVVVIGILVYVFTLTGYLYIR